MFTLNRAVGVFLYRDFFASVSLLDNSTVIPKTQTGEYTRFDPKPLKPAAIRGFRFAPIPGVWQITRGLPVIGTKR